MPINIICPGCHSRFSVGDKFAGKQGPCPKCKTVINIPKASEEVKIHAPEDYGGAKGASGKLVLKPISRTETKLKANWVLAIGAATIVTIGVAFIIGRAFPPEPVAPPGSDAAVTTGPEATGTTQAQPSQPGAPDSPDQTPAMVSTVPGFILGFGALLLSLPMVLAGYSFLRNDDDLEPYHGKELWIRAGACALVFALLWGMYALLRAYNTIPDQQNAQIWIFVGPAFVAAGAAAGYLALDLEFTSAAMLYGLYLVATVGLRVVMGLNPV